MDFQAQVKPECALYFDWIMFNLCPEVVWLSQIHLKHKNANWQWRDSSFSPVKRPGDAELKSALWLLVYTWITACEFWSEVALKWERKSFSSDCEVMTNKHRHCRASSDMCTGMPLSPYLWFIQLPSLDLHVHKHHNYCLSTPKPLEAPGGLNNTGASMYLRTRLQCSTHNLCIYVFWFCQCMYTADARLYLLFIHRFKNAYKRGAAQN